LKARLDAPGLVSKLREGSPGIAVGFTNDGSIYLNPATLFDGDEEVVAERLAQLLT
jgi:hypothetical protein